LIFNKSDGSESDYTIESNISLSSLDHGIENTSFDNDINFKANEIALEQNYDNVEEVRFAIRGCLFTNFMYSL
jgi:hypothetical protein